MYMYEYVYDNGNQSGAAIDALLELPPPLPDADEPASDSGAVMPYAVASCYKFLLWNERGGKNFEIDMHKLLTPLCQSLIATPYVTFSYSDTLCCSSQRHHHRSCLGVGAPIPSTALDLV
jgi:hypothetical protein